MLRAVFIQTLCGLLVSVLVASAEMNVDWAYHDDADGLDDRATESVPGSRQTFLDSGSAVFPDNEDIILYVITANQFAGDKDEQVFVRWWNGKEEHWIEARWLNNVTLGGGTMAGTFHTEPLSGQAVLDVWQIQVPSDMTLPGENYYVIQLKGWSDQGEEIRYLLRDPAGDQGGRNNLDQSWTANPDYFGKDWSVTVQ